MGVRDWINDIYRTTNSRRAVGATGLVADTLGDIGEFLARGITHIVPGALGDALRQGVTNAGMGELLGEVLANVPLAGLQKKIIDTFKSVGDEIGNEWGKADEAAYSYGKQVGLAAYQVERLRDEMISFGKSAQIGNKYNKSLEELIKLQTDYAAAVGRSVRLTNQQLETALALSAVVGDEMAVKFSASLENFGLSATDAGSMMTQMFNKSVKQGISLQTYAKNVADHITMAQKYTFKRGLDGLTAMAEKAAKMRTDMDMVAQLAENLSNVEKAVNVSAQLQVLGGPFAQFADPMALLNGSLNDIESLQDRLQNMTQQLGRFNRQTGQIDLATYDKIRLREAASAMGISYEKLIEQTTTQARRGEIDYQMQGLSNIPEEYKELLRNTATFENGVAGARGADGSFKALSELNNEDLRVLADNSKSDSENIADIAQMLRGYFTVQSGTSKEIATAKAEKFGQQAASIKGVYDTIGQNAEAINKLIMIELANKFITPYANKAMGVVWGAAKRTAAKRAGHANGGIIRTHDSGGYISDGTTGQEMILNSAQHGEFVVNAASVMKYLPLLNMINSDRNGHLLGFGAASVPIGGVGNYDIVRPLLNGMGQQGRNIGKLIRRMDMSMGEQLQLVSRFGQIFPDSGKLSKISKTFNSLTKAVGAVSKFGSAALRVGAAPIAAATAGVTAWKGYKESGDDVMNRGKAIGGTIGATAGALIGGAVGSLLGPIGTMVGASVGQAVGKWAGEAAGKGNQARRIRKDNEIYDKMDNLEGRAMYANLKGSFSVREMKKISKALNNDGQINDNELDDKLRQKMLALGNEKMFRPDDRMFTEMKVKERKYASGGLIDGPSHAQGGVQINTAEGGEFVINKEATAKSLSTLTRINDGQINDSNIRSREPMGKMMKVRESEPSREYVAQNPQSMKVDPINVNISGTIKLDAGDGQTFDITKMLMDNPTLINKITDLIVRQMNIDANGGFDKKAFKQRYLNY